jgi:centrin-3
MLIYVNINKRLLVTLKYSERDPTDEILRAFKLFDEEGKGRISLRNLKKIARELGENLTEEEL